VQKEGWKEVLSLTPDYLVLQETRIGRSVVLPTMPEQYHACWNHSARSGMWGVATLSRRAPRSIVTDIIESPRFNQEGRALLSVFDDIALFNLYVPHGGRDGRDLKYKLEILGQITQFVKAWEGPPLVVAGDLNIARGELDLARPKSNQKGTMFTQSERAAVESLINGTLIDAVRQRHPTTPHLYSWWPYAFSARERNVGWRIDYILVPTRVRSAITHASHAAWIGGSDHCPIVVDINANSL
jgi:exodeoxyribonuclease-3